MKKKETLMSFETTILYNGIQVFEKGDGGSLVRETGESPRATWQFGIVGASNAPAAYDALYSYLEEVFVDSDGNIASYNIPLDSIKLSTTENDHVYDAEVVFAYRTSHEQINEPSYEQPQIAEFDYTYTTTGGTAHITHSLATLGAAGADIRNFDGGIGWNGDSFDGVDIVTPRVEFSIGVNWPKTFFTQAYRLTLANATGCINSQAWNGFAAGCVLFRGVTASPQSYKRTLLDGSTLKDYYWRAQYAFEASPASTHTFNSTTLVKRGFDYLWALTEKIESSTGNLESRVVQMNVEQVYPEFNFANLLLPLPI